MMRLLSTDRIIQIGHARFIREAGELLRGQTLPNPDELRLLGYIDLFINSANYDYTDETIEFVAEKNGLNVEIVKAIIEGNNNESIETLAEANGFNFEETQLVADNPDVLKVMEAMQDGAKKRFEHKLHHIKYGRTIPSLEAMEQVVNEARDFAKRYNLPLGELSDDLIQEGCRNAFEARLHGIEIGNAVEWNIERANEFGARCGLTKGEVAIAGLKNVLRLAMM